MQFSDLTIKLVRILEIIYSSPTLSSFYFIYKEIIEPYKLCKL